MVVSLGVLILLAVYQAGDEPFMRSYFFLLGISHVSLSLSYQAFAVKSAVV